ncbi:uncharacterized protein LOC132626961 isoform X2 [Lycium barbarum]|uniref:uncharacterized protein LOC132626961 isoform X2 n=1 Tax=Lycium barbarum TaxID=112863 RepID=UPI00293E59AF|nr:uncharacterized protein LOC132626961 isoform X2 [Lycium barbarum]
MSQQSNMNQQLGACVFTQEQYSQLLQMLNKSSAFSANANIAGLDDMSDLQARKVDFEWLSKQQGLEIQVNGSLSRIPAQQVVSWYSICSGVALSVSMVAYAFSWVWWVMYSSRGS